jgi:hypothetical protein
MFSEMLERIAKDKHSSLFDPFETFEEKNMGMLKGFQQTNTMAYLTHLQVSKIVFKTLAPGVDVIKLFSV